MDDHVGALAKASKEIEVMGMMKPSLTDCWIESSYYCIGSGDHFCAEKCHPHPGKCIRPANKCHCKTC